MKDRVLVNPGCGVTGVSSPEDCSSLSKVVKIMPKTRLARACDVASLGSRNMIANTVFVNREDSAHPAKISSGIDKYRYFGFQPTSASEEGGQTGRIHPMSDRTWISRLSKASTVAIELTSAENFFSN